MRKQVLLFAVLLGSTTWITQASSYTVSIVKGNSSLSVSGGEEALIKMPQSVAAIYEEGAESMSFAVEVTNRMEVPMLIASKELHNGNGVTAVTYGQDFAPGENAYFTIIVTGITDKADLDFNVPVEMAWNGGQANIELNMKANAIPKPKKSPANANRKDNMPSVPPSDESLEFGSSGKPAIAAGTTPASNRSLEPAAELPPPQEAKSSNGSVNVISGSNALTAPPSFGEPLTSR
ncbi:hypothetical protein [Paenibacillus sp. MBLB4367]|uniref:hypothetical protein n=1 Tax=Paenibacillus sp. MBLB4367 TaxID=3384767 RepID=UPI0039081835